ncbi:Flagellin [Chromobacterium violaceum]|uniref:Flagellin n=1 Tax=Chromobacterium violaceum TaxID=536 RepID=A0A447TGE7_CHRVL|nr:flagellin [Chromobacterium violaceum]MCD0492741.1 Lateral flagellin [Chromobacterium violaceum]QIY80858.1 Lateral flagellin [Chromobacterium violaceum]VEB43907.1 Flagellin [Chromobacterium violaceum]
MLSLHTNIAALNTKSNMNSTQGALSTSMTRLGTGLRINSAMDDAAGLQIATRLDAQSRGMTVAMKNAQNGISMLQTAEGALNEVSNIALRMKDLATEHANGTTTAEDKTALKAEFDALSSELTNIMGNTTFGGAKLLTGGTLASKVTFQIGATKTETMDVDVTADLTKVDPTKAKIDDIDTLSTLLTDVSTVRSALGASANRLDHVVNNLNNVNNNTLAAKGRIMDTDYANESSTMTAKQMLMQASTSMLKQSGSMSSLAMSLLQ